MVDISVKDLNKFFVIGENLLQGLSFDIQEGECVAILGRNGCGKTTLFKILTGEMDYDGGEVYVNPNKKLGLISQIPKFPAGYTVEDVLRSAFSVLTATKKKMEALEAAMAQGATQEQLREYDTLVNRFQSGGGYEMDVDVDKICNGLGITAQQRPQLFESLSGGEKTRINLARLLLEKTDILLLDEPTNHLDLNSVEWLETYINGFKGTVLAISHDRYFIDQVADRVIEIVDGHGEFYSGNYSFYMEEKQARFDLQMKQYEQEQAKLKQLGYTVERMKGWGINNRTLYRRAMSIQHRMERIQKTERPKAERTMKASFGEKDFSGDVVFKMKNVSKAFGDRVLFSDVNLNVEGGERIALLGDNGTGKSTFIKCLLGEEDCGGKIQFGPTVKWGYLPQIIHFDHPERSLYDTMLYEKNLTPQQARDRLGAFMFQGEDVFKTVGTLSGGEQSRLRLCMLMDEKINLLILDEPTNHLDIASREWVEAAIEEFEGVLLFVSHDRYFIEKFAERIWLLENGTIRDFPCGYRKYRSILEHEAQARQLPAVQTAPKPKKDKPRSGSKDSDKLVKKLEREIEKQEKVVADLEAQIQNAASDYQELNRLLGEKETAEEALLELMEQWEAAQA
ncbi:ABC-F family ATP-binding cassette domain-containing protein [Pseudoflavonifractor sp. MSJ-30]|uniref:ribosomal protection-like ABC-F family protein n=1 Tax=Pseudoflavonifractor sp. MSJ-30 TaxID=2841525 RepID=UPI001C0F441E|nr:ABC-F family ATP-binding cassette domain-containing protein [Pseudoflavonifractor sp. MSJ-30]MBU5453797.1 ABC-F family ATP-binding cassette domain-containing protein [Pseudoflavonifractor sp. MSJ-30]